MNQQELQEKERLLEEKEQELNRREKQLDAFSAAMDAKKKQLYGKLPVTVKQVDIILWISCGLLAVVVGGWESPGRWRILTRSCCIGTIGRSSGKAP